jgi:lysophospholipase L1-like esterase
MKKRFAVLALVFSSLAVILGVELYLQVTEYLKVRVVAHRRYGFFEVDPFLQIRPKRNPQFDRELHVNDDSFRGDPVSSDPSTFRVFTLGGSTTYSYTLPYWDTYPAKLEQKLSTAYPGQKIQVENAASDWYSSEHMLIRYLFDLKDYKPDLVIVMEAINDLFRSFAPEWWSRPGQNFRRDYSHYLGPVASLESIRVKYFPFTEFLLYKKVRAIFDRRAQGVVKIDGEDPDFYQKVKKNTRPAKVSEFPSLPVFERNLRTLVGILKSDGVKVILLTQPSIYRQGLTPPEISSLYFAPIHCNQNGVYPDIASMEYGMGIFNDTIRKVARELDVPLVDLEKEIPKGTKFLSDDVHPTPAATDRESELIFEKIKSLRLLDADRPRT